MIAPDIDTGREGEGTGTWCPKTTLHSYGALAMIVLAVSIVDGMCSWDSACIAVQPSCNTTPLFYDGCVSADHNPDSHMDKAAIICHVLSREIQEALVCWNTDFLSIIFEHSAICIQAVVVCPMVAPVVPEVLEVTHKLNSGFVLKMVSLKVTTVYNSPWAT